MSTDLRHVLWLLIAGTRGGYNRFRILGCLRQRPFNAHQISEALGLDYRTIRYHLRLLERAGLVSHPAGEVYAAPYFLDPFLEANFATLEEVTARSGVAVRGSRTRAEP